MGVPPPKAGEHPPIYVHKATRKLVLLYKKFTRTDVPICALLILIILFDTDIININPL